MARSQTAAAPAATKPHRPTRRAVKKEPVTAAVEFSPSEHYDEIAVAAYLLWLERRDAPHSPESDWLRAEAEVRSRYIPG